MQSLIAGIGQRPSSNTAEFWRQESVIPTEPQIMEELNSPPRDPVDPLLVLNGDECPTARGGFG